GTDGARRQTGDRRTDRARTGSQVAGRSSGMNWNVEWVPAAEDELLEIWLRAPDRNVVSAAQGQGDHHLRSAPHANGRRAPEGLYRIDSPPLAISSTMDDAARGVEVVSVREII